MIGYLRGPITGNLNYMQQFDRAASELAQAGYDVINPAALDRVIPPGRLSYDTIMNLDLELLALADYLVQLPGWEDSKGRNRELGFAQARGIIVVSFQDLVDKGGETHGIKCNL